MTRAIITCIFLLSVFSHAYSQWWEEDFPMPRSYTYEQRFSEDEEWEPLSKSFISYDFNQYVKQNDDYFWASTTWKIQNQSTQRFNNDKKIIYESYKYWIREPYRLGYFQEGWYDWSGDLLISRKYISEDFSSNTTYSYLAEYQYDEFNNAVEIYSLSKSIRNKIPNDITERLSKYYFSGPNCMNGSSYYIKENGQWILSDSIVYILDDSCNFTGYQNYGPEYPGGPMVLEYEERYLIENDENNNQTKFKVEYRESEDEEWTLSSLSETTYNEKGQVIQEYYKYMHGNELFEYRIFLTYNDQDRLVEQSVEVREGEQTEWKKEFEWIQEYDAFGNVVFSKSSYNWDPELNDYRFTQENSTEYDLKGNPVKRSYYYLETLSDGSTIFERTEDIGSFRCDGRETQSIFTVLDSSDPEFIGRQSRRTTQYYLEPACSEVQSVSSIMTVFPNPARDYTHIYYPKRLGETRIKVVDETGREVINKEFMATNYVNLDLKGQKPGVYIIIIDSETVKDSQRLVIVN